MRSGRQRGLVSLDVKVRMDLHRGMIRRGVIGHEIEHQPDVAGEASFSRNFVNAVFAAERFTSTR